MVAGCRDWRRKVKAPEGCCSSGFQSGKDGFLVEGPSDSGLALIVARWPDGVAMPLHPRIDTILKSLPPEASLDVAHLPLEEALARLRSAAFQQARFPGVPESMRGRIPTQDVEIDGPHGAIALRIYDPGNATGVLVHFHGGGWVLGSIEGDEAFCQAIARKAGCKVVSVAYRLAPEHPYPIPLEDCYRAVEWVARNEELAPARLALCGASAGANLALAVALKLRESAAARPVMQVLLYPVCDANFDTESYRAFKDGYFLTRAAMMWFWDQYAAGARRDDPFLSPLKTPVLEGLPATLLITAEYDPLRDEGEAYACRLADAGVPVTAIRYPGMTHGFVTMGIDEDWGQQAIDLCSKTIVEAFDSAPPVDEKIHIR